MNDYLTNAISDHTTCFRDRCFHLLAAAGSGAELRHVLVEQSLRRSLNVNTHLVPLQRHSYSLRWFNYSNESYFYLVTFIWYVRDLVKMRAEKDVSAAYAMYVADIDCSKSKTRSCKPIWILMISSQLKMCWFVLQMQQQIDDTRQTKVTTNLGPVDSLMLSPEK